MSLLAIGVLGVLFMLALMALRMPIAFTMGVTGFLGFSYLVSVEGASHIAADDFFKIFSDYDFTVIPLFILMGEFIFRSGSSSKLYDAAYKFMGHWPGGLAIASSAASTAFAAITGAPMASVAAIGEVAIPEMRRYNYSPELACGCVAATANLATLIPPSVGMIIYALITEESIGKLFIAGLFPGLALAALFIVTIYVLVKINPSLGPAGARSTWKERFTSLPGVIGIFILFILVLGGLFAGIFTPTEAGAIGAFGALVLELSRRGLTWPRIKEAFFATLRISCMIYVLIACATVFSHFMAVTRMPYELADWIATLPISSLGIMVAICMVFFLGGFVFDVLMLVVIGVPIFLPVILGLGYENIWFGVVMALLGCMGVITPPVGVNCYVVQGVARDVPLDVIFRGVMPFLIPLAATTALVFVFPQLALFLPGLM